VIDDHVQIGRKRESSTQDMFIKQIAKASVRMLTSPNDTRGSSLSSNEPIIIRTPDNDRPCLDFRKLLVMQPPLYEIVMNLDNFSMVEKRREGGSREGGCDWLVSKSCSLLLSLS